MMFENITNKGSGMVAEEQLRSRIKESMRQAQGCLKREFAFRWQVLNNACGQDLYWHNAIYHVSTCGITPSLP